jgi:hypothetical protein
MTNGNGDKGAAPPPAVPPSAPTPTSPPPDPPRKSIWSEFAGLIEKIPVVGPPIAKFMNMSRQAKFIVIAIIVVFVVYPLVSLGIALLIISKSPEAVQKSARSFILNSIGVDERIGDVDKQMIDSLNDSNLVIDAAIPMRFSTSEPEQYFQKVKADQRITFEAYLRKIPVAGGAECAVEQPLPQSSLGKLTVRSYESNYQYTADIDLLFDRLSLVGAIKERVWKSFQDESKSGEPVEQHQLKISITHDPVLTASPFLKCNRIDTLVYMNIFKRTMVRGTK